MAGSILAKAQLEVTDGKHWGGSDPNRALGMWIDSYIAGASFCFFVFRYRALFDFLSKSVPSKILSCICQKLNLACSYIYIYIYIYI